MAPAERSGPRPRALCCVYGATHRWPEDHYSEHEPVYAFPVLNMTEILISPLSGYRANWFAYINQSHPDPSGMLKFLTDELQEAEDAGDRGMPSSVIALFDSCECSILSSMDYGPCSERMGLDEWVEEPNRSL